MSNLVLASDDLAVIALPTTLNGSNGSNRAMGKSRQIAVDTDVDAVRLWLAEYASSPHRGRLRKREKSYAKPVASVVAA